MAVSNTCSTGLLLMHIRLIATSILKIISSGGMVALNWNGGPEKVEKDEQVWEMFSRSYCTFEVAF